MKTSKVLNIESSLFSGTRPDTGPELCAFPTSPKLLTANLFRILMNIEFGKFNFLLFRLHLSLALFFVDSKKSFTNFPMSRAWHPLSEFVSCFYEEKEKNTSPSTTSVHPSIRHTMRVKQLNVEWSWKMNGNMSAHKTSKLSRTFQLWRCRSWNFSCVENERHFKLMLCVHQRMDQKSAHTDDTECEQWSTQYSSLFSSIFTFYNGWAAVILLVEKLETFFLPSTSKLLTHHGNGWSWGR